MNPAIEDLERDQVRLTAKQYEAAERVLRDEMRGEVLSAQCSVTSLQRGVYTCVMTGPQGVILDFGMEMGARDVTRMVLDDAMLNELLVVSSIVSGWIEVMLHERQQRDEKMRAGVPALPSGDGLKPELRTKRPRCVRGCQYECCCTDKQLDWVEYIPAQSLPVSESPSLDGEVLP